MPKKPYICIAEIVHRQNNYIIMEKKSLYAAPAVRELAVRYDASFLQSTTAGPIQDWGEDDDPINF